MTCLVICWYVSVSCKLLSTVSCRHGLAGSLESYFSTFFDLSGKLCQCFVCLGGGGMPQFLHVVQW